MAAPYAHAESSAKRWKGVPEDYLDIHQLMDSTKGSFPDNRHRAITHQSWFTQTIIPKIFGDVRINSSGIKYIPKLVAELHVLEDFRMRFMPSVQDYLENMELKTWMNNGLGPDTPGSINHKMKVLENLKD